MCSQHGDIIIMDNYINIVADDREQKSDVIRFLSEIDHVRINIKRLSFGDYQIDNRLLVERKTLRDFAISIIDGRLFKQTIHLASSRLKGVLILEGTSKDTIDIGVTREAMQGALITVSLILGIPVLRAIDNTETAKLIVYMAQQIKRMVNDGIQRQGYRPKNKKKRQLYILQGLPGIGCERAERLIKTFGSVEKVFTASTEDLLMVDGIGRKMAEKIRWSVSEFISPYGENASGEEILL
jgi:DNA excision repair protein ERCC-4